MLVTSSCFRLIRSSISFAGASGLGYWSLSAYVKQRVTDAVSFIGKFEAAVVKYAERYRVEAVLCGHIHSVSIREFGNITYYNCGDWVETCSALVEHLDGRIEIVRELDPRIRAPVMASTPLIDAIA